MSDKIYSVTTIRPGKLAWQIKFDWFGWSRIIGLALLTNLSRPAVLIYVAGWQIHFGRLPTENKTTVVIK